jgi:3-oxoadipate enol-lactonase
MNRALINGKEIAYQEQGGGEAVIFLHCGFVARGFEPLLAEPALSGGYRLINYHRSGYGESERPAQSVTIAEQAADCLALMDHLGLAQAHLVGHSFGALIAIEVARQAPQRAQSLALLEPPLGFALSPASAELMLGAMGQAAARYGAGDKAGAVEAWLTGAFGPGYQAALDRMLTGGSAQTVTDGPAAIEVEAPSVATWDFGPPDLERLSQPLLSLLHIDPFFGGFEEIHRFIVAAVPQAESVVLPIGSHLLQIQEPRPVAEALATFFERHPVRAPA